MRIATRHRVQRAASGSRESQRGEKRRTHSLDARRKARRDNVRISRARETFHVFPRLSPKVTGTDRYTRYDRQKTTYPSRAVTSRFNGNGTDRRCLLAFSRCLSYRRVRKTNIQIISTWLNCFARCFREYTKVILLLFRWVCLNSVHQENKILKLFIKSLSSPSRELSLTVYAVKISHNYNCKVMRRKKSSFAILRYLQRYWNCIYKYKMWVVFNVDYVKHCLPM